MRPGPAVVEGCRHVGQRAGSGPTKPPGPPRRRRRCSDPRCRRRQGCEDPRRDDPRHGGPPCGRCHAVAAQGSRGLGGQCAARIAGPLLSWRPSNALAPLAAALVRAADEGSRGEAANALVNIATRDSDIEGRSEPVLAAMESSTARQSPRCSACWDGSAAKIACRRPRCPRRTGRESQGCCPPCDDRVARRSGGRRPPRPGRGTLPTRPTRCSPCAAISACVPFAAPARRRERPGCWSRALRVAEAARREVAGPSCAGRNPRTSWLSRQLAPCMSEGALREEAAVAAVRIGRDIWNNHPRAVKDAMQKVIEVSRTTVSSGTPKRCSTAPNKNWRKRSRSRPFAERSVFIYWPRTARSILISAL